MGTAIGERNYIIFGLISFDIIFRALPSIGKCELMPHEITGNMYASGIFPQHTLDTEGCVIPNLFYSDPIKRNYTHFPYEMEVCPNSDNRLLNNSRSHIWVIQSNLQYYNATNDDHFRCCYKSFHLSGNVDENLQGQDHYIKYEDCILFNDIIQACHEFVRVFCYYNTSIIYNQLFAFVIEKPSEKPVTKNETFFIENKTGADSSQKSSKYNVIILGISSMSRRNFHRTMTKTIKVLKDKDTVEFFGYNRYASDKFHNSIPALLGKSSDKMYETCYHKPEDSPRSGEACSFIWERFKERGYYTALIEDASEYSISSRFTSSPTDYFFKPFVLESDEQDKLKYPAYCTGDKYTYKIMLDYIEQLCTTLQTSKLFGFFWQSSMSTKGLNYPIATDSDYEMLLQNLDETGYLNQTVLILLSDLGSSYGPSRENYLEERLPLFRIVLPPSFRRNYVIAYNNLLANSQRLVTVLDLHATLLDLANLDTIKDEEILIKNEKMYWSNRAISLFISIPGNRTCNMVGLSETACTCYNKERITDLSGLTAEYVAPFIIPEVNKILDSYPQCKQLRLNRMVQFSKLSAIYMKENRWLEYIVRVKASPEGLFEGVVRYDKVWSVVSIINRLDYIEQNSTCIDDPFVKIYCVCKPPVMMKLVDGPIF